MNLNEKLLEIQKRIDVFVKNNVVGTGSSAYKAVGSEQVLETIRPLMNEFGLLLEMSVESASYSQDKTSSGTTRYFTEIHMIFTWIDVESGEQRPVKWYGQGTDLAGEKGVGKAYTYAEKYFYMKFFHVPTPKDDPDTDARTKKGELKQKDTQAAKENKLYHQQAIAQMLNELCEGDAEKIKQGIIAFTKSDSRGYAGANCVDKIIDTALPVVYAKVKDMYKKRTGREFEFKPALEEGV
jgi:hypothetical protein